MRSQRTLFENTPPPPLAQRQGEAPSTLARREEVPVEHVGFPGKGSPAEPEQRSKPLELGDLLHRIGDRLENRSRTGRSSSEVDAPGGRRKTRHAERRPSRGGDRSRVIGELAGRIVDRARGAVRGRLSRRVSSCARFAGTSDSDCCRRGDSRRDRRGSEVVNDQVVADEQIRNADRKASDPAVDPLRSSVGDPGLGPGSSRQPAGGACDQREPEHESG